jgi:poly-gamma-glutamate synthesis protein (capsule biosynthesis protein)
MNRNATAARTIVTSASLGVALGALLACSPASSSPARREGIRQERTLHLAAVGDILLGDSSRKVLEREGYDYPFRALAAELARSDLVFGNLEGPITRGRSPLDPKKDYVYRSDLAAAPALHAAHVDLVTLANNHALDYGDEGLFDTIRNLDAAGVRHFGAGASRAEAIRGEIVEMAGVRIGFLGFFERYGPYGTTYPNYFARGGAAGVAELDERTMREAIGTLRPDVDVLVVCCHWGKNYAEVTKTQQRYGRLAAELGADLVIGHHPHVAQGIEVHHGVPILYSVGNFTFGSKGRFDQLEPALRHSWIAAITIDGKRVAAIDLIPLEVDNHVVRYQPRVADAGDLAAMVAKLNEPFGTVLKLADGRARLDLDATPVAAH